MFFVTWFWFFNVLLLGFTDISDSCGNYFHLLNIDMLTVKVKIAALRPA